MFLNHEDINLAPVTELRLRNCPLRRLRIAMETENRGNESRKNRMCSLRSKSKLGSVIYYHRVTLRVLFILDFDHHSYFVKLILLLNLS